MKKTLRVVFLACLVAVFSAPLSMSPAEASPHKHTHASKHKASKHKHKRHAKARSAAASDVRRAQERLVALGYFNGPADGLMGPKTRAALKAFQREQGLTIDGVLGPQTSRALAAADKAGVASAGPAALPDFFAVHADHYGHIDPQYADPMYLAPASAGDGVSAAARTQPIPTRFAAINLTEAASGDVKRYDVTVNGISVLQADGQPSVIGVSRTFPLDKEDAIIFTAYRPQSLSCMYKHYLLTVREGANQLREIGNCTQGYQAHTVNNMLVVTFPEADDARAVGATWRYDNGDLQKL